MQDDVAGRLFGKRRIPQRVRARPIPWVPGEMLVCARVDMPKGPDRQVGSRLRAVVSQVLRDIRITEPRDEPPLLIPTLEHERRLLFEPITLGSTATRTMREAVSRLNSPEARRRFDEARLDLVAATPNWFSAAQDCSGGSPGSQPVPADPHGSRVRYAPQLGALDLVDKAERSTWAKAGSGPDGLHVAVLDTAPTPDDLRRARADFPHNAHLQELLSNVLTPVGGIPAPAFEAARRAALLRLESNGGFRPIEPPKPFDIRDHGLFVAGVVHATAPWARMRLIRVLNNFGVGSLHSLVIALVALTLAKEPDEPLVVNLSLGMLPASEQLPDIWFGFPIEGLPGCPGDKELQFLPDGRPLTRARLHELVARRDPAVVDGINAVQQPIHQLMVVLQSHNCLVIAAAGNDSVYRGTVRYPRWAPRVPAVYDEVLGVAAGTVRQTPARYSNQGELVIAPVRDAVATLGGDLALDGVTPSGGVVGVYTAEQFPPLLPPAVAAPNKTGWTEWAGTSFAAPIMTGITGNLWATQPGTARATLDATNAAVRSGGRPDVADLGVPGVPIRLTWLP